MSLIKKEFDEVIVDNMKDYYEEILKHRAIANIEDGLFEVQRRALYGSWEIKAYSNKPHIKSVKLVAATLQRHAHGCCC